MPNQQSEVQPTPTSEAGHKYSPIEYVYVTLKMMDGTKRRLWALPKNKPGQRIRMFEVVTREGEITDEILLAEDVMVLDERPARMSLHYGKLESVGSSAKGGA